MCYIKVTVIKDNTRHRIPFVINKISKKKVKLFCSDEQLIENIKKYYRQNKKDKRIKFIPADCGNQVITQIIKPLTNRIGLLSKIVIALILFFCNVYLMNKYEANT